MRKFGTFLERSDSFLLSFIFKKKIKDEHIQQSGVTMNFSSHLSCYLKYWTNADLFSLAISYMLCFASMRLLL